MGAMKPENPCISNEVSFWMYLRGILVGYTRSLISTCCKAIYECAAFSCRFPTCEICTIDISVGYTQLVLQDKYRQAQLGFLTRGDSSNGFQQFSLDYHTSVIVLTTIETKISPCYPWRHHSRSNHTPQACNSFYR